MRFRATIDNVPTFYRIVQAIEKLQKKCVIKFNETEMTIICNNEANEGGIQVWSSIKVPSLFTSYRIQSNANNEITLLLSPEALLAALRSASSSSGATSAAEEVTMKLAKKNDVAVLNFEVSGMTRVGHRVRVSHDVRIEVMKPVDVARLTEPRCPEPDIHIVLPPLQKLRTIVERMRPLSDDLVVRANGAGRLVLGINTESVTLDTTWTNCANPKMAREGATQGSVADDDDPREDKDPEELSSVLISIRSFLKFLNSHVVSTTTMACICEKHCMILYVYIGDVADAGGVLTFYIPTIISDDAF
ncbi:hypothetical protein PLICRDRAFT_46253 [Plicaturopsis crispa FD-325 SS-3]|uniref:Checkpoint protein n=1 Tax=Plicaturopsis crispa FD-325 SS-3 TaxID=944288 RepID=A0A0C9SXF9_PLICR|nr:hypothetical protein PLICRDRAFT_46253 [Plicaturopsis crispa FD-325 SS-3]